MTVLVFHRRYDKKLALVGAVFNSRHAFEGSVFVFRQEQDEAQRVARVGQQAVDVLKRCVDELFAVWWIRLERASRWEKVQEGSVEKISIKSQLQRKKKILLPSRSKIRVSVTESRAVLTKIAIKRTGEALKSDAKVNVETVEDRSWNRGL